MKDDPVLLDHLVATVLSGVKYRQIEPSLVRWIGQSELRHQPSYKEALKSTRSRLHQVGAAYQESLIDYAHWSTVMDSLPADLSDPSLQALCRQMLRLHASTRERLPILDAFFAQTLDSLPPVASVLDLACGLNPLSLPWMPLAKDARYVACDIYADMVAFINLFFLHVHWPGQAVSLDLTHTVPDQPVDLALLLKSLPCLEQLDKAIGPRLLAGIHARHLLVSFPVHSLGGKPKGMPAAYEARFRQLLTGRAWKVERYEFKTELAFLISGE